MRAGQNAEIGDPNPYRGQRLALARCWLRGYITMLTIRTASTPARQRYLAARAAAECSTE
ncbi:ribosome modulation factor [Mycolicibacterium sp.]|uniref:ribosome modulation factor n=1 Tax=Mycolicibacterium sp. TaxID=2320850 RepID=UPI003D0DB8E5